MLKNINGKKTKKKQNKHAQKKAVNGQ